MDFLRNLPTQQPQQLTQLIQIQPGRVVSMAMSRQEHCQMTLLAFGDGESISEECYFGDTLYYILEGGALCLCGGGQPLSSNGRLPGSSRPYPPRSSCSGWLQAAADHAFIMI